MQNKNLVAFLLCIISLTSGQESKNHLIADPNGTYHIYWDYNAENITFELHVATKGYVGFGFSPNGGMSGADVIIGWVLPNGTSVFHDRHALGSYEPVIDTEQNYQLLNASENATHTIMRFTRKLNTCNKDDMAITDDTMKIIFSWHPDDPQDITGLPPHGPNHQGTKSVYLLHATSPKVDVTDDIFTWDVQMPNVTVPLQLATYWCFTFKLQLQGQHDNVGFDVILRPEMQSIFHHVMLFQLFGNPTYYEEQTKNTKGLECEIKDFMNVPIYIWATGSEGFQLPDNVGNRMGENYGGADYYLIQVHYNNVELKSGYVDDTIIRFYLTNKPRPIKAGILEMNANIVIPPQQQSFPVTTYCPEKCTRDAIPDDGISVYAVGLHAHMAGRKITLRHFRNNTELQPIAADYHFDYNYQQLRHLAKPVTVLPGDLLIGQCEYNTMDRNETVLEGNRVYDEMCYFYIYHYPATPLVFCVVVPPYKAYRNYFLGEEMETDQLHVKSPASLRNMSMFDAIKHYNWNAAGADKLKQFYKMQYDGVKEIMCIGMGQKKNLQINTLSMEFPANASIYKSLSDTCADSPPLE